VSRAIAVVGLGHVGSVVAACLAERGHTVIAVDRDARRVAAVEAGEAPVEEPRLASVLARAHASGRLSATLALADAVTRTRATLVCVGTPSNAGGTADLRDVEATVAAIGRALRPGAARHVVVLRSTVPPGTTRAMTRLLARESALEAGRSFGVCVNPEFLREGSAVDDFEARDAVVIGETDRRDGDLVLALERGRRVRSVTRCDPDTAELLKYLHNAWNALRVSFANEAGAAASAWSIDARAALSAFAGNGTGAMTPGYLVPGAAWGGGCLGKDLETLRLLVARAGVAAPLLDAIAASNRAHVGRCVERVVAQHAQDVTLVGLAFKPGTADVRDSPFVALAERLAQRIPRLRLFDAHVADDDLAPALRSLRAPSLDAALDGSALVVLCHGDAATRAAIAARGLPSIDFGVPVGGEQPLASRDVAAA